MTSMATTSETIDSAVRINRRPPPLLTHFSSFAHLRPYRSVDCRPIIVFRCQQSRGRKLHRVSIAVRDTADERHRSARSIAYTRARAVNGFISVIKWPSNRRKSPMIDGDRSRRSFAVALPRAPSGFPSPRRYVNKFVTASSAREQVPFPEICDCFPFDVPRDCD